MTKITFIGAGSTVFAKNLLGDILSFPELADSTISLMDIDPERLRTSEIVAHKVADFFGASRRSKQRLTVAARSITRITPSACSRLAAIGPAQ
jgi:alpha-galactosidase/6-phospho-beta-glucosidase family protein